MSTVNTPTKKRGVLYFDSSVYEQLKHKPTTPEEWHAVLLLPESYTVESAERCNYGDVRGDRFELILASDALPECSDIKHVVVHPTYTQHFDQETGDRTVTIDHISISQWDGERWNTTKQEIAS